MSLRRRLLSFYARIARTYWSAAPSLLPLALVVFVPLGLIDALTAEVSVDSLTFENGVKVAAILAAVGALTTTGLLGEVFFSGAVAISLSTPADERPPSLIEIARRLKYGRLIAVDILYVLIVFVGLLLVFVPGILAFVWFGLAGPVVEIEQRTVRGALARSWALVRGNFWFVFLVLGPIELIGDTVAEAAPDIIHHALGDTFFASWLAESASNVVFSPIFALAAVLLTLDRIREKDGEDPTLNPAQSRVTA